MDEKKLKEILDLHAIWLENPMEGKKADLQDANLRHTDLQDANLRSADLQGANLENANLRNANLRNANLKNADLHNAILQNASLRNINLRNANLKNADLHNAILQNASLRNINLRNADLHYANLEDANLEDADLRNADLRNADLRYADLEDANLQCANLHSADFHGANLQGANLQDANLYGVNLRNADLSQIKNSPFFNQYDWLCNNFKKDKEGFFVYKRIGDTDYRIPDSWEIKEKSFIAEEVDTNRIKDCSYGVNFGTYAWCDTYYVKSDMWLCKLHFRDALEVCVPIYTDGKARCGKLQLIRIIKEGDLNDQ